jgi:hypothetical protein
MFCLAVLFQPSAPANEPLAPTRSWQFHTLDSSYVSKAMKRAGEYNINTVVFSHGMIGEVSQLYSDPRRAAELRKLAAEAHDLDLKVWIWIHELEFDVPKRYLDGAVHLDRPGFWDWLEGKYDKLFVDYPEFDGILLTFRETKYKIFQKDAVKSKLSIPERFAKMINTVDNVRDLEIRRFTTHEPNDKTPVIVFENVKGALVQDCSAVEGTGTFQALKGESNAEIEMRLNRLSKAKIEMEE